MLVSPAIFAAWLVCIPIGPIQPFIVDVLPIATLTNSI